MSKTMRILHLNTEKSWRGGEQQVFYLIQSLNDLYPNTKSLLVCKTGSTLEKKAKSLGLNYHSLPFLNELDLLSIFKLKKLCLKEKIQIIHSHTAHAHTISFFSQLLYRNKVSLVVSRRVDYSIKNKYFSQLKYKHSKVKKIICVSHAVQKSLEPYIPDTKKLCTIHSGIDISHFSLEKEKCKKLRNTYQIPKDYKLIGNTGALSPQKDYISFIYTAKQTLKKHKKLHFFIIGEGKEKKKIESKIQKLGLEKHITLTGFRNDIPEILPELDIFLSTSQDEALGTSILDAFASQVPVVATNVGGVSEMVIHKKTGLLSPAKDINSLTQNLSLIISSPQMKMELVNNAKKHLTSFSKENTAKKIYKIYKEIISETT